VRAESEYIKRQTGPYGLVTKEEECEYVRRAGDGPRKGSTFTVRLLRVPAPSGLSTSRAESDSAAQAPA